MRVLTFSLLLIGLFTSFSSVASDQWIVKNNGIATLYSFKKDSRIRGSVRESKRVIRPSKFKDQNFREKIVSNRKAMLAMLGATDWEVRKQIWQDSKILMIGSYKDREGAKVSFLEIHHYKKTGTLQALLTATGTSLDEKSKMAKDFFKLHDLVVKW